MGLRELRQRRGLSQVEVAERVGMSQQNLSAYELGGKNIHLMSLDNVIKLCDVLNCTPKELVED